MLRLVAILSAIGLGIVVIYMLLSTLLLPSTSSFDVDSNISARALKLTTLPNSRPFLMGFTHQPFDWSEEAFQETAELVQQHADTITIFYDVGVPWIEAYEGKPYHVNVETDIERQLNLQKDFENVILLTSFLGSDRVHLAQYAHGDAGTEDRPGIWADLDFNDSQVVTAYLNYCRNLIDRFQPDYFGYVAEVDSAFTDITDSRFIKLRDMSETIYTTLKSEYPDLVVFAEFNLGDKPYMEARADVISALLPYSDIYALSAYPARFETVAGDARKLSADWFDLARHYALGKPIAILETGFHAEHFMHPTLGVRVSDSDRRLLIPGGERSQALYTKQLLAAADRMDMEFVVLWTIRDLDALFTRLEQADPDFASSMLRLAEHMGLYDRDGNPRAALDIWDTWLHLPLQTAMHN